MVNGEVCLLKDWSQLELVWCHLVMTCLTRNTELKSYNLQLTHEGCNTLWNASEVVVVHLLVLGRVVTHQGAACQQQVRTGCIKTFVNKEVLLLPAEV